MTRIAFALFTLVALSLAGARPGAAETYRPWCADYGGSSNCGFSLLRAMQDDGERDQYLVRAQPLVRRAQTIPIGAAMKQNGPAVMSVRVSKKAAVALFALLAVAPLLDQEALAGNGIHGGSPGAGAVHAIGSGSANHPKIPARNWIALHRPDGEVVHVNADQIVFVMSATALGGDKRANSKLQLTNGFVDVRESVEEVMRALHGGALNQISDT